MLGTHRGVSPFTRLQHREVRHVLDRLAECAHRAASAKLRRQYRSKTPASRRRQQHTLAVSPVGNGSELGVDDQFIDDAGHLGNRRVHEIIWALLSAAAYRHNISIPVSRRQSPQRSRQRRSGVFMPLHHPIQRPAVIITRANSTSASGGEFAPWHIVDSRGREQIRANLENHYRAVSMNLGHISALSAVRRSLSSLQCSEHPSLSSSREAVAERARPSALWRLGSRLSSETLSSVTALPAPLVARQELGNTLRNDGPKPIRYLTPAPMLARHARDRARLPPPRNRWPLVRRRLAIRRIHAISRRYCCWRLKFGRCNRRPYCEYRCG